MIEVEHGIDLLLKNTTKQDVVIMVPILDSLKCVLAEDIISTFSVPNSPRSAMDGYAIMSKDSIATSKENPIKLKVIGHIMAGDDFQIEGKVGTTVRIMTGGVIPAGYDCVIKQEDTDYNEENVAIYKKITEWENYCKIGEDIKEGQLIIPKYTRLYSHHIGVLASLGLDKVSILRPMKVSIISTGGELTNPGQPLGPAQIYNSCGYMLCSFLKNAGVDVVFFEICKDDPEMMIDMVNKAIAISDLLITTGGVSVGQKDIVPDVLEKLGAEILFKTVNMKPGTPVLASFYKNKIILGLSGNPFATFANFHLFFWSILEKFMSNKEFGLETSEVIVKEGSMKSSGLRRFVRAYAKDGYVVLPTKVHKATVLSNLDLCNCLIDQKANTVIKKGDKVSILYL